MNFLNCLLLICNLVRQLIPWPSQTESLNGRFSSAQFSHSVMSDSLRPHGLQHQASLSITNSQSLLKLMSIAFVMPSNNLILCYPFSFHLQSFPTSVSFPGGQSIGVSASAPVPQMNSQEWFPSGLTGLISLQFKGLSRVFPNTTVQKYQFFSAQLSL